MVCRAHRLQPSEARALTLLELEEFNAVLESEQRAIRGRG